MNKWLDTFLAEKGTNLDQTIEAMGELGMNFMPLQVIVDAIKAASPAEQASIKTILVKIDFANGDIVHFFKHLAKAIAI